MRHDLILAALVSLALLFPSMERAEAREMHLHFRAGPMMASYNGGSEVLTGSVSLPGSVDLEFEVFSGKRSSFLVRSNFSHDFLTNRLFYAFLGAGARFYFGPAGEGTAVSEGNTRVYSSSRFRFFGGLDLGISQVTIRVFNDALSAQSSMIDFGGHLGSSFRLSEKFSLEALGGASVGFGFSTVSVNGIIFRGMLGISRRL